MYLQAGIILKKGGAFLKLRNHNQIQVISVNLAPVVFKDWRSCQKAKDCKDRFTKPALSFKEKSDVQVFHWQFYKGLLYIISIPCIIKTQWLRW